MSQYKYFELVDRDDSTEHNVKYIHSLLTELNASFILDPKVNTTSVFNSLCNHFFQLHYNENQKLSIEDFLFEICTENKGDLHIEYKKENRNMFYPVKTCYLYLSDSFYSVILTEIDFETYKYKTFSEENHFVFSFVKKYCHLSFNGCLYHGFHPTNIGKNDISSSISNDIKPSILKINIWERNPKNI